MRCFLGGNTAVFKKCKIIAIYGDCEGFRFRPARGCGADYEGIPLHECNPGKIKGKDRKEELFVNFISGDLKTLITKPKIGAFGLNFQNCAHVVFFPSHSYEQYYQGVRRCWRFGQKNPVCVDVVSTVGEIDVLKNLRRKAKAADKMFDLLVVFMNDALKIDRTGEFKEKEVFPAWL